MKRRFVIKLCVFLLLGAVVNVAVAWGCMTAWPPRFKASESIEVESNPARTALLASIDLRRFTATTVEAGASSRTGWSWYSAGSLVEHVGLDTDYFGYSSNTVMEAGWPMRAVRGSLQRDHDREGYTSSGALRVPDWAERVIGSLSYWEYFPIRPIALGFATNTVFYATILWLLFAAPGRVRRWRRIRRGLCAKCAYPVGASDVCTECGAQIRKTIRGRGSRGLPSPAPPAGGESTP